MTRPDLAAPLEPEVAVVLDDWVRVSYESGLRNVEAHREIARLRVALAVALELFDAASAEAVHLLEAAQHCVCGAHE